MCAHRHTRSLSVLVPVLLSRSGSHTNCRPLSSSFSRLDCSGGRCVSLLASMPSLSLSLSLSLLLLSSLPHQIQRCIIRECLSFMLAARAILVPIHLLCCCCCVVVIVVSIRSFPVAFIRRPLVHLQPRLHRHRHRLFASSARHVFVVISRIIYHLRNKQTSSGCIGSTMMAIIETT